MDQSTVPETSDENNISIVTNDTDTSSNTSSDKDDQLKDQTVEDMDDEELKGMMGEDEFETEGMDKEEK